MRDLVYPPVVVAAQTMFAGVGLKFTIEGVEHLPRVGGAVLASNHVSYLDFTFVGLGPRQIGRYVRFMAKESVFGHPVAGPLMRGMHHIPVDRAAGSESFKQALRALKSGEYVGVFPEATISRSFELKEFKAGAVRLAGATGVPLIPTVVWGGQRIYTKGRRPQLPPRGWPITVLFGEPITVARGNLEAASAQLLEVMGAMLHRAQREFPASPSGPADSWWQPAALGGSAPTPQAAAAMSAAEKDARE